VPKPTKTTKARKLPPPEKCSKCGRRFIDVAWRDTVGETEFTEKSLERPLYTRDANGKRRELNPEFDTLEDRVKRKEKDDTEHLYCMSCWRQIFYDPLPMDRTPSFYGELRARILTSNTQALDQLHPEWPIIRARAREQFGYSDEKTLLSWLDDWLQAQCGLNADIFETPRSTRPSLSPWCH
jgi:hypothetical protein